MQVYYFANKELEEGGMRNGIRKIAVFSLIVAFFGVQYVASEVIAAGAAPVEIPLGQSAGGDASLLPEDVGQVKDDNLFGLEGGYFHPYITLNLEYTDNLYNIDKGQTESLLTMISPGIWFALPRKKIIPITINPHNSSPGGLQLQFEDYSGTDRFQAYALGGLDLKYYSGDSDLNTTDGLLEGMARWNMRGGLALQLVDRFTHGEDKLEVGSQIRDQIRRFDSNFFMATADWDITEKLRVQFDYFNFLLGYDDEINQFLDRTDNGIDLYGYFKYSLTTSFFLQYKYVDVSYEESELINNNSHFIYGGIKWDTTEKLAILAKIGYQMKKFDDTSLGQEDIDAIAFDVQFTYRYSEKTKFDWDVYRTNEETDNYLATDKTVIGSKFKYSQKFSDKWSGLVDLTYEDAEYSNLRSRTNKDRDDTIWAVRPALQYLFRDWLMFEVAYRYDYRDSTDNLFDFDANTFIFNANLAL
jgi:hypothetical protein